MFNSLIIGQGEIGRAVKEVISGYDKVDTYDIIQEEPLTFDTSTDILHICFPYTDDFIDQVRKYVKDVKPWHVVIWSTVPIGTTGEIKGAVHTPVEGRHPNIARSIRDSVRWIGTEDETEGRFIELYFKNMMLRPRLIDDSLFTEALKLLSTTEYGVNIEFARYKKHVADSIGMDFELAKEWNRDYNKLYRNIGMAEKFQKYILDAPTGPKGGHCVTANAQILQEQYPNDLVKIVGEI